jgi:nucleoside-diphosphate-sugar epimerase
MKVVITGGTGFIGRKLALKLLERGTLAAGKGGAQETIDELTLFDVVAPSPPLPEDRRLKIVTGDVADPATMRRLIGPGTHSVFHLAAVVSAEAEADFEKGVRVNLEGTRAALEAARALGTCPRFVFASSLAVYGGELPPKVSEKVPLTPQTSYGIQKAIGELLVNDYSRKGFIDGRALRLPTIVIRPGRPNRAASTFASSILREPLAGQAAVCPVGKDVYMPIMSPRRVVDAFIKAHDLPADALGPSRAIQLPSVDVTVGEMVEALRRAGGEEAVARIRWEPDPVIQKIVAGWPVGVDGSRAERLGIKGDKDIDEIVRAFIEDDLPAQKAMAGG